MIDIKIHLILNIYMDIFKKICFFNAEILQATHSHYKIMNYNINVNETIQPRDDIYIWGLEEFEIKGGTIILLRINFNQT